MAKPKVLKVNGEEIYPVTHESAVVDDTGRSIKDKFDDFEKNQLKLVDVQDIEEDPDINYVTKDSLAEELENIDLTKYQEVEDEDLATTNKTIVGAINELFQSANNGKQLIANAIGSPLSSEDTFQAMSDDIDSLLDNLRSVIGNKGVSVSDEKLQGLIELVNLIGGDTEAIRVSIISSLAEALGEPTSSSDSVTEMCDKVDIMTQDFRNQLVSKGVSIEGDEQLVELVERVDDVGWMGETEIIVVQSESWSTKATMTTARAYLTSSIVDNKIYCIGGKSGNFPDTYYLDTNECYDPSTDTWSTKATMTTARGGLTSSTVNNLIYCIGGQGSSVSYLDTNECYDPSTDTWSTKATMTTARRQLTSSTVNNLIYCIGGRSKSSSTLNLNECYDPSTDTWSTKASMSTARRYLTSSTVDNKIYVIGGDSGSPLNLNECYDPSTDTWSTKASMSTARRYPTSSVVNNKIYVIGGYDGSSYSNTNECYDPSTDRWTTLKAMTTAREGLTSSAVNNLIYCIGGYKDDYLYKNEYYSPYYSYEISHPNTFVPALVNVIGEPTSTDDTVYTIADKLDVMKEDFATKLSNKGVSVSGDESLNYLIGSIDSLVVVKDAEKLPSWYEYNPVIEDMWITAKAMTTARSYLTSSVVNNFIYCIGGYYNDYISTNQCYDPSTNSWSSKANMTTSRSGLTSSVVNNKIYCIGGNNGSTLAIHECYDPSTNTWSTKADMTTSRSGLTSSVVNNLIYCIGGYNGSHLYTNECYDPSTNTWSTKATMTTTRAYLTSSVVNNLIYVIGGFNNSSSYLNTNECYDPSTDTWSTKASMTTKRYHLTSSVVNNKIYCIGGNNGSNLTQNECYDPSTNTWSTKATLTTARYALTSSVVGNQIYCIGGNNGSNLTTNECYIP